MLRITTLALFSFLSSNAAAFDDGLPKKSSEQEQGAVNLATITQSQMEAFGRKWPVRHEFSKKDDTWRWYDAKGKIVARLRRTTSDGKRLLPFANGAVFTQGASDFRFVRVFRNGRRIGSAGWYLTKDGKWTLLYSRWQGKPGKDAPAGEAIRSTWFRPDPFSNLGQPQKKRENAHFVRLAVNPRMQRDMNVHAAQQKKLNAIYRAAVEDGVELFARWGVEFETPSPLEAQRSEQELERRTALVWKAAKLRAEAFLTAKQIRRIRQIMVQRLGQRVFFDRNYAAKLKLDEKQRDTLEMKWKEHLQRVKKNGVNGKQSYRRFWSDAYKVLSDNQRRALEELRGPPLKNDGKTSAAPAKTDGADVIGTVLGKPVLRKDIRKEFRLKHELSRLFLVPVLNKYEADHRKETAVTDKEIARLIRDREQRAKKKGGVNAASWRRLVEQEKEDVKRFLPEIKRKLAQNDLKPAERRKLLDDQRKLERRRKQPGRAFAEWYLSRLKFQQSLYRRYGGGRILWQQAGPEAFDAMHRWLQAREKAGDFRISDPALRAKFYEYWTNTRMHGAFLSTPKDKTNPVQLRFPWNRPDNNTGDSQTAKTPSTAARKPDRADWGGVAGRVVWKGPLKDARGVEGLVVDPKTRGIRGAFVFLESKPARIHPSYVKQKRPAVTMVYDRGRYSPRSLVLRVGQPIKLSSRDPGRAGNFHARTFQRNAEFNVTAGTKPFVWTPQRAEASPVLIASNAVTTARAWWLIVDHPYATITGADGSFRLDKLPAGEHTLTVWHESAGYVVRGLRVTVKAGRTSRIADRTISAAQLKKKP